MPTAAVTEIGSLEMTFMKEQPLTTVVPYGEWVSPITPSDLTHAGIGLDEVAADGVVLFWVESRPTEGGRSVIVRRSADGTVSDVSPAGFNSRTRAHEYGGGGFGVRDGIVVSSEFTDQRVYRLDGPRPSPITPEPDIPGGDRFADFEFFGPLLIAVRERHHEDREPDNELVAFPWDGSAAPRVIAAGHDFCSSPRVSPDGSRLAWLTWDHPRMPWEGTELWMADLSSDGSVTDPTLVAGGETESIFQPEWSPDGLLHFVSDRSGWWNLYRREADGSHTHLVDQAAEWGSPQWVFGMSRYRFLEDGRIASVVTENGRSRIVIVADGKASLCLAERDAIGSSLAVGGGRVWTVAGSDSVASGVIGVDPDTGRYVEVRSSITLPVDPSYYSRARSIVFPTTNDEVAHAFYYPPSNPDFEAPAGELPPLVVWTHGGPTGASSPGLSLGRQFWTSRGFALVDVNYRGSVGYGREYRRALEGLWGILDSEDCIAAARYLVSEGFADPDRLSIRGGSAGGYTTLAALTFHDAFATGASYFGVADLGALAEETHKFESRYLDSMIGPYPEAIDVYTARSPIHHVDLLNRPMLLLQGLDDKVVPPEQAEVMVEALAAKGIAHAYLAFEGEGHGFRSADAIERAAEAELAWYGWVFGFRPAGQIRAPEIRSA